MAFSVVQAQSTGASGSPNVIPFGSNNTAGNVLIVSFVWAASSGTPTLSDSQGNTYAHVITQPSNSGNYILEVYVCYKCNGGANTVTISGATTAAQLVGEFSGINTLDNSSSGHTTYGISPASFSGGNFTRNFSNETVFAFYQSAVGQVTQVNSPLTLLGSPLSGSYGAVGYATYSSTGTDACSAIFNSTANGTDCGWAYVGIYQNSASTNQLMMMGLGA